MINGRHCVIRFLQTTLVNFSYKHSWKPQFLEQDGVNKLDDTDGVHMDDVLNNTNNNDALNSNCRGYLENMRILR